MNLDARYLLMWAGAFVILVAMTEGDSALAGLASALSVAAAITASYVALPQALKKIGVIN